VLAGVNRYMNILYVSSHCSPKVFAWLFRTLTVKPQQQAQKFHRLVTRGLAGQSEVRVTALSRLPVSRISTKRVWINAPNESERGIYYHHLPHLNIPIGAVFGAFCAFVASASWCMKHRNTQRVIVCDALNLAISSAARLAGNLFGVKTVAIVTDLPDQMRHYASSPNSARSGNRFYPLLCNLMLTRYDAYVLLTLAMNSLVNPNGRPYLIMEGLVEAHPAQTAVDRQEEVAERILMYAGALHAKYGVKALLNSFAMLPDASAQLWLCGAGDLDSEVQEQVRVDSRIRYLGVIPNEESVALQRTVTLLVNPRPSCEEFTKYSFPSKNMEYMASGTPVLTTPLPGMPKEYYDYVYLFEDESVAGMARTLEHVLSLPKEELHAKGAAAKEFVLREKNNVVQTKRIVEMICRVVQQYPL